MTNRKPDEINSINTKIWYDDNEEFHNENGYPAITNIYGFKAWYKHGKLHNNFGPAEIYFDGSKYWYINGIRLSEEEFKQHKIKQFIGNDK